MMNATSSLYDAQKHPDLIYDVGMHKGEDTEFYLKKGFQVVAFDADPNLVALCRKRFSNIIDQQKLTIVEGAWIDWNGVRLCRVFVEFVKRTNERRQQDMAKRTIVRSHCPAKAYLDAGTASLILQFLAAGIFGAMFVAKAYWQRIKEIVSSVMERTRKSDG